jgi:hypothetical protein
MHPKQWGRSFWVFLVAAANNYSTNPLFDEVNKMRRFLALNKDRKDKETGELYREHIPERVAGISSDEVATDLGMSVPLLVLVQYAPSN